MPSFIVGAFLPPFVLAKWHETTVPILHYLSDATWLSNVVIKFFTYA